MRVLDADGPLPLATPDTLPMSLRVLWSSLLSLRAVIYFQQRVASASDCSDVVQRRYPWREMVLAGCGLLTALWIHSTVAIIGATAPWAAKLWCHATFVQQDLTHLVFFMQCLELSIGLSSLLTMAQTVQLTSCLLGLYLFETSLGFLSRDPTKALPPKSFVLDPDGEDIWEMC